MSDSDTIDVLLYGLGAIGSFYAFILHRSANVRLTVVARSNYDAVVRNGITIISEIHGQHTFRPHRVVKSPAEASGPFDFLVCAHKAIDQPAVAQLLKPAVHPSTTIVLIQNGVGNEEPFREVFPDCSIVSCVTWVGATQTQPGIVAHSQSEDLQLGLFSNPSVEDRTVERRRLDAFAALLARGNTRFQVVEDIQLHRWAKVVWNAAWNSLTTLTMLDTRAWLRSSPGAEPMTRRLMREVIAVARKCGVPLEDALVDALMAKIQAMPGIGSSMQTDCRNGRPLEVDVILGFPARKARELGVQTPVLETVYTVLRAVDVRLRGDCIG